MPNAPLDQQPSARRAGSRRWPARRGRRPAKAATRLSTGSRAMSTQRGSSCRSSAGAHAAASRDAGHHQAELAARRPRRAAPRRRSWPSNITRMRSASDQDLVELDRDQQDRLAGVAQRDEPAVDELDGADIDAARRLADEQQLGIALDLARQHDLLLVAAGEVGGLQPRIRRPHVVSASICRWQRSRTLRRGPAGRPVIGRIVVVAEDRRFRCARRRSTRPIALAVLRHMGEPAPPRSSRGFVALRRRRSACR